MSDLSQQEAAAVFGGIIPEFRPDSKGNYRGAASYRNGDNKTALSIQISNGGRYFDHVLGKGGDCVDFVRAALKTDFKSACKVIADMTGRDLLKPLDRRKRRFSTETLVKAARFRVGILWHIDRGLAVLKDELFGPNHDKAAIGVKSLTEARAEVSTWSDYKAADAMCRLSRSAPRLVNAAIQEAAEAERTLAEAIASAFGERREAA